MTTSALTVASRAHAADLRRARPTVADQNRNPDINVMAVWRDDIEHTIQIQGYAADVAEAFRAACGA